MAKTLKQLFKTQKLDTGTTGQAKYEIRNSKDNDITTSNPLLAGTSFPLVNKLRKGATSERRKETLLEEETTGLRPLRFLSTPVLYTLKKVYQRCGCVSANERTRLPESNTNNTLTAPQNST